MNICSYSPTKYLDDKGYNDRLRFLFKNVCYLLGQGGGGGSVSSVGLSMPSAFSVANSPVTTSGTLAVTGAGTTSQYIRGDGSLGSSLPSALTPTWQQVLTAGSTLTGNNTIATAGFNFIFDNVGVFRVNKSSILRLYADGTSSIVSSPDGNSTISVGNNNINIAPDGLGHGIVVTSSTTYIGNLANSSTQDRLVGQTSSSSILGYITLGAGLSLSSGVLNTSGTVPTPISSLTAATGFNTIDNADWTQTWRWNSLGNAVGLVLLGNSTTAASNGQTIFQVTNAGANSNSGQTTYSAKFDNSHTGTSSTNVAGYFSASTGTTNYAIQLDGGDIVSTQSTQNVFNTTSTTVNAFGAATTLTIGGTPTTAITHNYSTNATAAATTKTINLGTGGAASSTTDINIGTAVGGTTALNSTIITLGGGTTAADLRFLEPSGSGTNYAGFKAPALAGNTIYTLPTAFPAGDYLMQSSSAGVLSFIAPSSLSGLSYWALTGTSTLSGATAIDMGGQNLTITGGSGTELLTFSPNPANAEISIDGTSKSIIAIADTYFFNIGVVQMNAYGAGAATFDAGGNITSVSDERLKNIQEYYKIGLEKLMEINPIIYKWKPESGMETEHNYAGFSAQNIQSALGDDAIGINKDGYLSIQDRALLAASINSIKELKESIERQQEEINNLKQIIKNNEGKSYK